MLNKIRAKLTAERDHRATRVERIKALASAGRLYDRYDTGDAAGYDDGVRFGLDLALMELDKVGSTMTTITFTPDAGESLDNFLSTISGYTVQVTPEAGEPFDATLIGPDHDAGWHGTILVRRFDEEQGTSVGPTFSVVAKDIEVY